MIDLIRLLRGSGTLAKEYLDLRHLPFSVTGYRADHPLTVAAETAKEAFAKAVEWHVVKGFTNISISDGIKSYSINAFASVMALQEIANTVEAADDEPRKC